MNFIDYREHLQELLDAIATDTFNVSNIRNFDGKSEKVEVIINALAGSVYKNSASIPYVIDIYTKEPESIENIFTLLAKERNGKSFIALAEESEETKEYTCFEFFSTPSVVEKDLEFGSNRFAHIVVYITLNILFEVGNVSKIEIDNEELEFINGTLAYSTELYSNRVSGQPLNKARKVAGQTSLSLTLVNKENTFTNALWDLMVGNITNKVFSVKITLTTGKVATLPMICNQNAFNFAQNSANLPSLNVGLILANQ